MVMKSNNIVYWQIVVTNERGHKGIILLSLYSLYYQKFLGEISDTTMDNLFFYMQPPVPVHVSKFLHGKLTIYACVRIWKFYKKANTVSLGVHRNLFFFFSPACSLIMNIH